MKTTATYKQLTAGLLFLLFSAFYVKTSLFLHTHIIDGVKVVHSHIHTANHTNSPYDEHTDAEIELIDKLSDYQTLAHNFSTIVPNADMSFHKFQSAEVAKPQTEFLDFFFLRGPPRA